MDYDAPATKDDISWFNIHLGQMTNSLGNWMTGLWLCTQAQIILIGMKLGGVVDWGWVALTVPTWAPMIPLLGLALIGLYFKKGPMS